MAWVLSKFSEKCRSVKRLEIESWWRNLIGGYLRGSKHYTEVKKCPPGDRYDATPGYLGSTPFRPRYVGLQRDQLKFSDGASALLKNQTMWEK